jgi:glucokinase
VTPVLAVDVGGSAIKAEIQDAEFRPLLAGRRPTPPAQQGGDGRVVLDVVAELARELLAATPVGPVRAVGVGVPGIVDAERGIGLDSANLGWRNAPVAAHLGAALGLPVAVRHDVAAAGSAELRRGAGRGARDALFVVIGTGIAGAVLAGGALVAGGAGQAGEIGHIRIRPTGPRCGCGARGCLETFASARAIAVAYTERTGRPVAGAADVLAVLPTDADARAVWADAVAALADGLLITQAVLAPELVVLGGGLASAGSALLDPLAAALHERATVQVVPRLLVAELGERAGVVGVGMAARELLLTAHR